MRPLFLAAVLFSLAPIEAAPKKPAKTEQKLPAKPEEYLETIEALLTEDESDGPMSKKQIDAMWRARIARVDALIAGFRQAFPEDPRRWEVLFWEANSHDVREEVGIPRPAGSRPSAEVYAEILAAPDAPAGIKARASGDRLVLLSEQALEKKLPLADWEKMAAAHFAQFPDYPYNTMLHEQRMDLVRKLDEPRLIPLLEELAKHPRDDVATLAGTKLAAARERAALKARPLDLKFKALGGAEVDMEKLRGKVVLVHFWATWSSVAMEELSAVQAAFEKLHARGLEVVGISLDDDEKALRTVLKKRKVQWPQFFDGKSWENPFARRFGVETLPTLWLVDKQGHVAILGAEPAKLVEELEKLLAQEWPPAAPQPGAIAPTSP